MLSWLIFFLTILPYFCRSECNNCPVGPRSFTCNTISNISNFHYICCNGLWIKCGKHGDQAMCQCPNFHVTNLTMNDLEDYHLVNTNRWLHKLIITAKLVNDSYVVDRVKSVKDLVLGQMILWPGSDIGLIDNYVVMPLEHYNVSLDYLRCCPFGHFNCVVKMCCGLCCC
jgi:hypothetical protein